jgi:uncharacterized protein (DUF39 family)
LSTLRVDIGSKVFDGSTLVVGTKAGVSCCGAGELGPLVTGAGAFVVVGARVVVGGAVGNVYDGGGGQQPSPQIVIPKSHVTSRPDGAFKHT